MYVLVLFLSMLGDRPVHGQERLPPELEPLKVVEHRGELIPKDLEFTDDKGQRVRLAQYFTGQRPVVLNLAYYSCPMLCTLVLNGMATGLKGVAWSPGVEFEVVSVSIDPRDKPDIARAKKANYVKAYGRPATTDGWHFLTGSEKEIKALADSVGFSYRWNEARQEYEHPAVIFVLTPQGKISRYLYGIDFASRDLRLAISEASEGKVGSAIEQFLLFCFHYDPVSRKYALYARNVMRLGGGLTALVLGTVLFGLWRRERRMGREAAVPISGDVHGAQ